ncbi:hypothetical protein TeGR_g11264 [Tetraparma gracilis]|jgi:NADH dehydrogenase (ubiquinone) 1 alpha subcomplex subunit 5|uniref:Uncharacterized protein n=1 Tax=Tetraparma gracilis TaxID=2962635 RepID=A0ABQ6N3B9_9STRA|nr:hypothetical protein TeGR_g11264 [Tetraparma gracilis]
MLAPFLRPLSRPLSRSLPLNRLLSAPASSGPTKTSTGLVGLAVHPDPIPALIAANERLLVEVQPIPANAAYRENIEAIANFRINTCKEAPGDSYDARCEHIETVVNCGQIEELIIQAEDELEVIEVYIEEKMWENTGDAINTFERNMAQQEAEKKQEQ